MGRGSLVGYGLVGLALAFAILLAAAAGEAPSSAARPDAVRIEQVEVRASLAGAVVLLKVGNRAIPVFVDAVVAESIHGALTGAKTQRPLSHDLMHTILAAFEGRVTQAVITLKGNTYYGDLTVNVGDTAKVFDSRSSDAIALAIHFKAPILVSQELLDTHGVELEAPKGVTL